MASANCKTLGVGTSSNPRARSRRGNTWSVAARSMLVAAVGWAALGASPAQAQLEFRGWGYDLFGQASPLGDARNVKAISASFYRSVALKNDGTVIGWGYNFLGEAAPPRGLTDVVAVSAGSYHTLALKADGTVVGWGRKLVGQEVVPPGLTGMVAVASGADFSLALKGDGTVTGWGYTGNGQALPPDGLATWSRSPSGVRIASR